MIKDRHCQSRPRYTICPSNRYISYSISINSCQSMEMEIVTDTCWNRLNAWLSRPNKWCIYSKRKKSDRDFYFRLLLCQTFWKHLEEVFIVIVTMMSRPTCKTLKTLENLKIFVGDLLSRNIFQFCRKIQRRPWKKTLCRNEKNICSNIWAFCWTFVFWWRFSGEFSLFHFLRI